MLLIAGLKRTLTLRPRSADLRGVCQARAKLLGQSPCRDPHSVSCSNGMTDAQEKRLIEALRKVDAHGDVAPAHVQDPMTMVLRKRAIQADLMRWDDSRGHYGFHGPGRR